MKVNSKTDLDRMKRTKHRQKKQAEFTRACEYAIAQDSSEKPTMHTYETKMSTENSYRMITEGVLVDYYGEPYEIVGKGSLKRWYDSLDYGVDYDIDIDHAYDSSVFRQAGTWNKSDLTLVELEDGRYAIDIKPRLDEENIFIKELRRRDTPLALSIEFYSNGEMKSFEHDGVTYNLYCHEDVDIVGLGIVSEPQDSMAGNLDFNKTETKEGYGMSKLSKEMKEALLAFSSDEEQAEPEVEETQEEVVEEEQVETEVEETEEDVQEDEESEVEEAEEEQDDEEETADLEEVVKPLLKAIKDLQEQNKAIEDKMGKLTEDFSQINSFNLGSSNPKTPETQRQTRRVSF